MHRTLLISFATALIAQYSSAVMFEDDDILNFAEIGIPVTEDQEKCLEKLDKVKEKKLAGCEADDT